jgi:pyruvate/2-oxoglutarate dehydrogenase complex dihydrolipoamide acyltransferase (E2) component
MIEVFVPRENVNDESVVILAVHFSSGVEVRKGDIVVSIETSKTNIDIQSEHDGVISHRLIVGDEISVGALLFTVGGDRQATASQLSTFTDVSTDAKFSQAALKRAQELGVKLTQFTKGWITSSDVENAAGLKRLSPIQYINESLSIKNGTINKLNSPVKEMPLSKRKQAEIKNLQMGDHASTTSSIGIEIRVPGERVIKPPYLFRNSISDLIVYEGSRLLKQYPELNAAFKNEKKWAAYEQVNFGWSFDNGKNLKVLAIKNSDEISLINLQEEVERLLNLYESGESIPNDLLLESTVTFSDLSHTESSYMLPLINGCQTLILGVVRKSKNLFEIFASFDHRVSEGLSVVKFLGELKNRILSYYRLDGIANISCYACGKNLSEELGLGYRGFVKITLASGEDENLCRNCFEGW